MKSWIFSLGLALLLTPGISADDALAWPQFRGPGGSGGVRRPASTPRRRRSDGLAFRAMAPKGKWAAGITPRNFCWVVRDRLAVCERPGGYGANHRRVRRQEEIIWLRE